MLTLPLFILNNHGFAFPIKKYIAKVLLEVGSNNPHNGVFCFDEILGMPYGTVVVKKPKDHDLLPKGKLLHRPQMLRMKFG